MVKMVVLDQSGGGRSIDLPIDGGGSNGSGGNGPMVKNLKKLNLQKLRKEI